MLIILQMRSIVPNCHCCHLSKMSLVGVACEWMPSPPGILCSWWVCAWGRDRQGEKEWLRESYWVSVCVCVCHSVTLSPRAWRKINRPTAWVGPFTSVKWWADTVAFKGLQTSARDAVQTRSPSALRAPAQSAFHFSYMIDIVCFWELYFVT